jgi:hypothetical protein
MNEKTEKFKDEGERVFDFSDEFLVECPKCRSLARVVIRKEDTRNVPLLYISRKLVCSKCGLSKLWDEREVRGYQIGKGLKSGFNRFVKIGGNFDWYFQQPLWLQIECSGETLWAYNEKHLEFIENYVAAKLRERTPNINRSLLSRLPQWIKSAKNRDEILRAIRKLKEKLPAAV